MKTAGLLVVIGVLAIIYAELFALWDLLTDQPELSIGSRLMWLVVLLAFPALGTVAYLRMGPGDDHWPPWESSGE